MSDSQSFKFFLFLASSHLFCDAIHSSLYSVYVAIRIIFKTKTNIFNDAVELMALWARTLSSINVILLSALFFTGKQVLTDRGKKNC